MAIDQVVFVAQMLKVAMPIGPNPLGPNLFFRLRRGTVSVP